MEKVIIIGSGPAGHTAAIYAAKAMLEPLMFEGFMAGGIAAGGQLTTTTMVENFPGFADGILGPELMMNMRQQSINSGVRIETKTVDKVDLSARPFKVFVWKDVLMAESLIISTGAIAKRMWLPGEEKYRQRWVSACAVCDWWLPTFRDQPLVVIGGGDAALEEAMYLTKFASKVYLFVRRDELRASKAMQEKLKKNLKVEVMRNTEAKELLGDEKWLNQVRILNNKTQEESVLDIKWLFYAIWHKPNTDFLEGQVEVDKTGYIVTKPGTTKTSVDGVFAAGDVQDKHYRQAITSAGTGCMAALEVEKWVG